MTWITLDSDNIDSRTLQSMAVFLERELGIPSEAAALTIMQWLKLDKLEKHGMHMGFEDEDEKTTFFNELVNL